MLVLAAAGSRIRGLLLGLAVLSLTGQRDLLEAQGSTFDLSGTILDELSAPLPDVTLTLTHEQSGRVRTTTSNESGHYVFAGLAPGTYFLEVARRGYATSRYAGLHYFANTKPILNVTLLPRAVQESMTFTGEAPLINSSQSQLGLSVDERQQSELPLQDRDYLELVTLATGVTDVDRSVPGSAVPGAKSINMNGFYARYTAYRLDGFDNTRDEHGTSKIDLALDSLDQFRVITNQFSAEYGESMAGIVSAVTRSGGNDYHGTVFAFVRPGGLDGNDPLTGEDTALDRQEVGFAVSGPLRRYAAHFFGSFEYRNEDREVVVTAPLGGGRYRGIFDLPSRHARAFAKLTHQLGDRGTIVGTVIRSDASSAEGVGGLSIFENREDVQNDDLAALGTWTSLFGDTGVNQLRVGFSTEDFASRAAAPPEGVVLIYPTRGIVGNPHRFLEAEETQWQVSNTLTVSPGDHQWKIGAGVFVIDTETRSLPFFDGAYRFAPTAEFPFDPGDPSTHPFLFQQGVSAPSAPDTLDRAESHLHVFFQDDWQVDPHVTLSFGLRWEKETSVPDNDNFAPRLGFHWDATRDGRTSIRGGYGIFHNYVFSAVDTLEGLSGPLGYAVVALAPEDPGFPEFPGSLAEGASTLPRNVYVAAPELSPDRRRSPYAHHFTLGLEREIVPTLSIAADLVHILGRNLILPADVNAPSFFDYSTGLTRSALEADRTRPFGIPGRVLSPGESELIGEGFPFAGYRDLYLQDSRGRSEYWALKINVIKRYAQEIMLQAAYTWSRARNDGDDFRPENSLPLRPGDFASEWGRSATDVPHAFVVNGLWDAPFDLRVAGVFRARSGHTVDPRVGEDLDGDRKTRERAFIAGRIFERNSFRSEPVVGLDLSVSKLFDLGQGRSVEGRLDVLNVANRLNAIDVLNVYGREADPLPTFLEAVTAEPPRQFQLSLRFRF